MTVSTTKAADDFVGNGATTTFPFAFKVFDETHLEVYLDGVLQELDTHYTVGTVGGDTTDVVFVTAPPAGKVVSVFRTVPLTQETDYLSNDEFPAETHERALDLLTMGLQQVDTKTLRSLRAPEGDLASIDMVLPDTAGRSGMLLGFDPGGVPVAVDPSTLDFEFAGHFDAALDNVFLGDQAGASITTGTDDTLIGDRAGALITTGAHNTIIGSLAGMNLTTGIDNVCIGSEAGRDLTTGSEQTLVGRSAGEAITTGTKNTMIGADTGEVITTGNNNTGVGHEAMHNAVGASDNVALGVFTLGFLTAGNRNTAVGSAAGQALTTADDCVFLGRSCAKNATTGHDNIVIGAGIDLENPTDAQKLIIGNLIFGTGLPTGPAGATISTGNVGIGIRSPSTRLHVDGPVRVRSYTVAGAPSASAAGVGSIIHVTDGDAGGPCLAVSNGTNWKVVALGSTISGT